MMTLREYLKKNASIMKDITWKVLFFQLLFSLYKIGERLSQFRHNMLNLDSIVLYIRGIEDTQSTYKVGDSIFNIPNVGFDIKLTDYDKATTADYIPNTSVEKTNYNDYYDVHYFITYLQLWLIENSIKVPQTIENFIKEIVPAYLIVNKNNSTEMFSGLDVSVDYSNMPSNKTIPLMILKKNNFFHEFILTDQKDLLIDNNMDMSATPIEKSNTYINDLDISSENGSQSDYSITDIFSDEPRFLAKQTRNSNSQENKKSSTTSIIMPSKSNIRNKKIVSSVERGIHSSDSDILEKADKNRKYKKVSRNIGEEYSAFDTLNSSSNISSTNYDNYFKALREVGKNNKSHLKNSNNKSIIHFFI